MKHLKYSARIFAALAAVVFSLQSLQAAPNTWNNAAGGNWSVNGNWSTGLAPGLSDDVIFFDVSAGTPTTMDATRTVDSLTYDQDNGSTHTTVISPNQTLTINRTTAGSSLLLVGASGGATGANTLVPAIIQGTGAALVLSGTNDMVIQQGNGTAGAHMATLDMSGLDTFTANVGRLLVGQANAGASVNRPSGTLLLAKTNTITLTGASAPQVMVQDSGSNANGGTLSQLTLGQVTRIFADQFRWGGQKGNGNVNFNAAFTGSTLVIRNTDGVSRSTQLAVGDNSFATSGNSTVAVTELSGGISDLLIGTVYVARGNPGPGTGTCTGTLGIGAGTNDFNTLEIGYQISTGLNGAATGLVGVNNNSLLATGAVLRVNTSLELAHTNSGGTGPVAGTLGITNGTVLANTIVAGGGASAIRMGSGAALVISNTAGTLPSPIKTFTIDSSTLVLPALNSGAALFIASFTSTSANFLTVSAIPPIGSYPATFTLVSYQTQLGSSGTFTLNPLPPGYAGSLIDLGSGVIQLQLTSGPVANLSLLWTGAMNNNWDTGTFNWFSQGMATNFFAGGAVIFNDSASQNSPLLTTALSPGTMLVSNNVQQYDFNGPGNIAGATSLTKKGSQTAIIENQGVDNFGSVTISSGILQLGTGDTNGDLSTPNITNNAALVVNRSGTPIISAAITGTGSLTNLGGGTLTLSGASTYSGATVLSSGGLEIDGSLSGGGPVTTASGTLLTGSGSVSGLLTAGGQINPGLVNAVGTLTAGAGLTLSTGASLVFDLNGGSSTGDAIAVTGNVTANNNAITANFLGVPQVGSTYPVITYSGSLFNSFNSTVTGSHFTLALDTVSSPGTVFVDVTGGTGANLEWTSTSSAAWDSTTVNWTDQNLSAPSLFYSGDTVLLDDTAGVVTGITLAAAVYPSAVTNMSDGNGFTISGPGKISGTASIVKAGGSTLTISTANDFTGTVDIQAGTLKAGNNRALGSTTAGTTIESGATLDVGGQSLGAEPITASGAGIGGAGAIVNSGGAVNTAFNALTMAGDTSIGGSGQWAINNSGGAASLSSGGQPYKLTKVGANLVGLQNLSTVDAALGDIEVQQGTLEFNGLTPNMGDPTHTNFVDAGATLQFASDSVVWNKFFDFDGNGVTASVSSITAANTELAGAVQIADSVVFNSAGSSFTVSGPISGTGTLIKTGTTALVLSNTNSYTGDTDINIGALRLSGIGSISNSPNIVIAAGATLTVTGRVDVTFTLNSGQTLSGGGVINGNLTANSGSTITPGGVATVGFLTVSNNIVLGGTTTMDLNQDTATNDLLRCNQSISYSGTLSLNNLGSALTNGATFKLFNAASYSGAFATLSPAIPGAGQVWNTNSLTTSGIISVVSSVTGPTTNATITKVTLTGTNMVVHGTNNNVPNTSFHYVVLSTPNITNALSNWIPVVTNPFNANGTFDYTNPIVPGTPRQFIDIKAVP